MTPCERLSERMPAVAAARETWSADEAAHLGECSDCQSEWRLVRAAGLLGVEPAIDPAKISAALRPRLTRKAPVVPLASRRRIGWALAAAAVAVLAIQLVPGRESADRAAPAPAGVLTELDELDSGELETVLADLGLADPVVDDRLDDLSPEELQRVLTDWESET